MKTQRLYIRYFSKMDFAIKILLSSDTYILHILKYYSNSLYSLIVNMHCLKVLGHYKCKLFIVLLIVGLGFFDNNMSEKVINMNHAFKWWSNKRELISQRHT